MQTLYFSPTTKKDFTMSRKPKAKPDDATLLRSFITMFVPSIILEDFEVWDASKKQGNWVIELREKQDRIPSKLATSSSEEIVLDGYCNPISMLSYGFSLGPVYLKIYRRRWKLQGQDKHHSNNHYDFSLKGYKMVPELGLFLKEEGRRLTS